MTVDERARHQLFVKLEEVLGPEEATTLMATLPPLDHDEIVTKAYLDLRLDALEHRMVAAMRHDISNQTRTMVFALIGVVVSISSVALFR